MLALDDDYVTAIAALAMNDNDINTRNDHVYLIDFCTEHRITAQPDY